jgi:pyrroloquinoline quinone biosynthesis protein D
MAPADRDRVPARVVHFSLERLDDEILLYHPGLTKAIQLNPPAALVWELCDGQRSEDEIATLLSEAYPDQGDEVRRDVEAVLHRLSAEGAITFAPVA